MSPGTQGSTLACDQTLFRPLFGRVGSLSWEREPLIDDSSIPQDGRQKLGGYCSRWESSTAPSDLHLPARH